MKALHELVTARASQEWTDPINSTNYNLYAVHWIETAGEIAIEFDKAGLGDTAELLRIIAKGQEKFT